MRKNTQNSVKLGVFVTIGILLFMAGIYYIGQKQRLFRNVFRISGVFNDVNGLQVGNNVRFSGINVGTVDDIDIIADTSVRVTMVIDLDVRKFIKKDARAIIGSEGLMGNKIINITPGTSSQTEIQDNDVIATMKPFDLDAVWGQLKKTADNAQTITSDLAAIVDNIRSGKGTIGKLFMDSTLAMNLNQTLTHVKKGAKGFEENMDAAQHSFLLRNIFKRKQKKLEREKKHQQEEEAKKN